MGETPQPEDEAGEQGGPDLSADGQHSIRVRVDAPVGVSSRPLANFVIVFVIIAVMVVVSGRSSATREQSLRTSDASQYVEPPLSTTINPTSSPVVASTIRGTATSIPGASSTTGAPTPTVETVAPPAAAVVPVPTETAVTAVNAVTPSGGGGAAGPDDAAAVSRAIPVAAAPNAAPPVVSPWADKTTTTAAGYVATSIGCASGTSAASLDAFFRDRIGPAIGLDYQHVYALGGKRYLWLFQDTFVDYSGNATKLSQAVFAHNTAMIQDGACFTLYHHGSIQAPTSFEQGTGGNPVAKWFWPMGGETFDGKVSVYWAQMERDGYDPRGADGLGWHPVETWLAVYDAATLQRLSFQPASNAGVTPIYGYAVASDSEYTYLFGNSFEQNLQREGGYYNGPHSATKMWLARVPLGQFGTAPEYRTGDTWTGDSTQATPISQRYWAENPMQPRYLNGQWVAATKENGYWGDSLAIDVANDPWGPWTTVEDRGLSPRGGDSLMNTYNAYLMPWVSGGSLVVSVSNNARNMLRDAWPNPARYRPMFFGAALVAPPPNPDEATTTVEPTTTILDTTSSAGETTTTFAPATTDAPTTIAGTTTTTTTTDVPTTTTTTTTVPTTTTTTTSTTTTLPATTSTSTTSTTTTTLPPCDSTSTTSTTAITVSPPVCDPGSTSTSTAAHP